MAHWAALVVLNGLFGGGLARAVKNAFGNSSIANGILLVASGIGLVILAPSAVAKGRRSRRRFRPALPRSELIAVERAIRAEAETHGAELLDQFERDHPELVRSDRKSDLHGQARWGRSPWRSTAIESGSRARPASPTVGGSSRRRSRLSRR